MRMKRLDECSRLKMDDEDEQGRVREVFEALVANCQ